MPIKNCILYTLFIALTSISLDLQSQTFDRVENIAGFTGVAENNGVAVADFDGDFDLDIIIVAKAKDDSDNPLSRTRLFRNDNDGSFTDVTESSGLTDLLTLDEGGDEYFGLDGFKNGAFWGDYNNDGFPDLFFTHSFKVQLFRNMGDGTFADFTPIAGIDPINDCRNTGALWFDYNNDGNLDLYVCDWDDCATNTLYRNNGNGTFSDVTADVGLVETEARASYTPIPFDINSDGWMDLYVTNDFEEPNYLYINQNGTGFTEQAADFGLDNMIDDMGVAYGDYNQDGFFDLFITGIDENSLLVNDGTNNFSDISTSAAVNNTGWAWGTRFADFDLDTDEDLIVVNGYVFEDRSTEENVFFRNQSAQGGTGFINASEEVFFNDLTVGVEAVEFDYDNDGDLDIFVTNSDQQSILYENKLLNFDESSNLNWFKVVLEGTTSNRFAIGTELTITTVSGIQKRLFSGVGFLGQSIQPVHFGLNQDQMIQELEVKWPSGLVETYNDLESNSIVKLTEGQGLEVLDVGPSIKVYGCTDPESCSYNPLATLDDGSCTYLESSAISGPTSSGFLKTETYSYSIAENSSAQWTVQGGEIISGQGTSSVSVKWHLEESGQLTVRENNGECFSLESSLEVGLNISNISNDTSIARIWNEALLEAIRGDFARPTVHARNLFHTSVAMYDAWAIYDNEARPYLIGNEVDGFNSELVDFIPIEDIEASRIKAISYACYRLLSHRFQNSPQVESIQRRFDLIMDQLGYETEFTTSTLYEFGNAAALGNYIAETIINFGLQDGSREQFDYSNAYYQPANDVLVPAEAGNPGITDPNRWQPLSLDAFVDQSGNPVDGTVIDFLSPEWGDVTPFAMGVDDVTTYSRDGSSYKVYNDPGPPPLIDTDDPAGDEAYKWGFSLVAVWGSHLDPHDGVLWDISPGEIGNIDFESLPNDFTELPSFYDVVDGGEIGDGHPINPVTGEPYDIQLVPRGDYARVLAEFWADGPDSETPPGHWFTILNYVNDAEGFQPLFQGEGEVMDWLEWNVKSYFIMGGAMHDSAISAWSVKGWYDYLRPISAIRYMADRGQSSDETQSNYDPNGIPLIDNYIEVVEAGDPLAGQFNQNIGKIKLKTWRGPDYINNPDTDMAGVGWILAENWWPYQRPTFVTPPFAGYVSGHSTYSRAAAEVMTLMTGTPFFPNGMGEFKARKNEFLVFEDGPTVDIVLQWATYQDASDQCSLSRIWGGIHPPADDIPGRKIGEKVGREAFEFAVPYFSSDASPEDEDSIVFPNPVLNSEIFITNTQPDDEFLIFDIRGRQVTITEQLYNPLNRYTKIHIPQTVAAGIYIIQFRQDSKILIIGE